MHPKFTAHFSNILEKKIMGGETASFAAFFYLDNRELIVKVGARFPRPKTMDIEC